MHPDEMRQYCTRGKYPSFQMHPWRIVFVSAMLSCRANWCRNCGHFMTFSRPFNLAVGIGAGLGSGCALPVNSASFIFQRHRKILARQISRRGRPRFFSHRKSLEQRSLRFPKGFSWKLSQWHAGLRNVTFLMKIYLCNFSCLAVVVILQLKI